MPNDSNGYNFYLTLIDLHPFLQAGSLTNLAKAPASTVQILGAEKALFRALKTKGNTPKYGIIYHSTFIGRADGKNKGRISRYLANKCSIATRIDSFSDEPSSLYGQKLRDQVEERLKFYETGAAPRKNIDVMEEVARHLKAGQDAMDENAEEAKKKKKKDKKASKKRKADDDEGDAAEDEQVIPCDQNIIARLLLSLMYFMQSFQAEKKSAKKMKKDASAKTPEKTVDDDETTPSKEKVCLPASADFSRELSTYHAHTIY